jgi:predicted dehydrogenase
MTRPPGPPPRTTACPQAYGSAAALAADPNLDLVTLAVKVPAHDAAVRATAEAGRDVYCEWPLGTHTAQAMALRDLAAARGPPTGVGHHYLAVAAGTAPDFDDAVALHQLLDAVSTAAAKGIRVSPR